MVPVNSTIPWYRAMTHHTVEKGQDGLYNHRNSLQRSIVKRDGRLIEHHRC